MALDFRSALLVTPVLLAAGGAQPAAAPQAGGVVSAAWVGESEDGQAVAARGLRAEHDQSQPITVVSGFYAFHARFGAGPVLNPVPASRERRQALAHRSALEPAPVPLEPGQAVTAELDGLGSVEVYPR